MLIIFWNANMYYLTYNASEVWNLVSNYYYSLVPEIHPLIIWSSKLDFQKDHMTNFTSCDFISSARPRLHACHMTSWVFSNVPQRLLFPSRPQVHPFLVHSFPWYIRSPVSFEMWNRLHVSFTDLCTYCWDYLQMLLIT